MAQYASYPAALIPQRNIHTSVPPFTNSKSLLLTSASNQYVDLGNNFRFNPTDTFSISAWIFPTSFANFPVILGNESTGSRGFDFFLTTAGALDFQWASNTGGILEVVTTATLSLNTWYHVVVTYDGSNTAAGLTLYVNGSAVTTSAPHNTALVAPIGYNVSTRIGNDSFGQLWNGYIDEVSIWNVALGQVSTLYNNGDPTNLVGSTGLLSWYRMGDVSDTGSTIYDRVGTANGTIMGAALFKQFAPFAFNSKFSQQVKNDANAPILSVSGDKILIPYYQSANADPGFDAPDLQVWDNSNRTSPSLSGTLASTYPSAITPFFCITSGNYVYLAYSKKPGGGGPYLRVIDISNPASPTSAATVAYDSDIGGAYGVAIYGTTLYVSGSNVGASAGVTAIIDISTPTSPGTPTYFATPNGPACSPVISGTNLFVAGQADGTVQIFDISIPTSPSLLSTITCSSPPTGLNISGNYLYITEQVGSSSSKVEVIDISNPVSPSSIKTLALANPFAAQGTIISARNLLIVPSGGVFGTGMLYAISIYDPANIFVAGTYTAGSVSGFTKAPDYITSIGDLLYVTSNAATAPANVVDFKGYLDIFQL
jgi:hypothetical protein